MASPIVQQAYLGLAPEDHDGAGATTETAVEGAGR
jgi:hypothetical protein